MPTERYQRHTLIDWFSQEDVKSARLAVIGAGAIGNEVIKNLALLGVGSIDVFDLDRVEEHNLTRSVLFRENDIGRSKAACAVERARDLDPSVELRAIEGDVYRTLTLSAARKYDSVICALDNFEARIRVNQLCRLAGTNMVNAAIDSRFASVESFPFGAEEPVACYECNLPHSVYSRIAKRYSCGWLRRITYTERKIPTTIVTSAIAGALSVSMALRFGNSEQTHSRRHLIDTIAGQTTTSDLQKQDACVGCGHLHDRVEVVQSRPLIDDTMAAEFGDLAQETVLRLSDQIITSMSCANCDSVEAPYFLRAADHDDSITLCERCGARSVAVTIRDTFTVAELLERRKGQELPCKFALMDAGDTTLVFDFDGMPPGNGDVK